MTENNESIWHNNKTFPEYGRLIFFVGVCDCHIGIYKSIDNWEWRIEHFASGLNLGEKINTGDWCYLDDLLEQSKKVERLEKAFADFRQDYKIMLQRKDTDNVALYFDRHFAKITEIMEENNNAE